jgi:branched-chain amino acid transport system permease protein
LSGLPESATARAVFPYAGVIALGVIVACVPYLGPTNHVVSLATSAAIFAIAGSGLGFLWGQSGQLSMAHAAVFGLGAYAGAITAEFFELGFLAAMPIAVVVGLIAGALVALPSLRTQGHYFVILTFAIGEVIAVVEKRVEWLTGGQEGISAHPGKETLFGLRLVNRGEYFTLIVLIGTSVLLMLLFIMRSRWGTTLRGLRENAPLAASLGVNVTMNRIYAFAISGAVAGLAGHLYLYQVRFIEPNLFTAQASIIFLMMVLLGGKAYLLGPAVGSFLYFFLSEFLGLPPVWNLIGFGAVLIVMILVAPNGILSILQSLFAGRAGPAAKTGSQDQEQQVADLPAKA